MLRPERMSRVSVTGSKQVIDDVIETVHDLNLLHVTEYDGSWEGFEPGTPMHGADDASDKLVTIRSLKSILDIEDEDAGPTRLVTDEALEAELEEIRQDVNELDDRRDDLQDELRAVEEQIDTFEPFEKLGIRMDRLSGYDSLVVAVGEGSAADIEVELKNADEVAAYDVAAEDGAVAIFVYPDGPTEEFDLSDLLVGAQFQEVSIPEDAEGSPEEYISELRHEKQQLESKLETVEDELEDVRLDVAGFLLAAEEQLTIQVQKTEAPLSFATTESAFIAEGWIPTTDFDELVAALETEVGEHVEVEELERASYDGDGHVSDREPVEGGGDVPGEPAAADGGEAATDGGATITDASAGGEESDDEVAADGGPASSASGTSSGLRSDGGLVTMGSGEPPVIQKNPAPAKPFEALTKAVGLPSYDEFDPTIILFLTFPVFYGFMIGDLGYGILYTLAGYWMYSSFDNPAIRSLGGVGMFAGVSTMIFGVLYGEVFGLHVLGDVLFGGNPPIHKGLQPHYSDFALAWLVLSLLAGILHLTIGWIFDFIENLSHGFVEALGESGSWLLMMFGLWTWIYAGAFGSAPEILFKVFTESPFPIVPSSVLPLPTVAGYVGLGLFGVGFVLLVVTEPIEGVEFLNVIVNVLSYTRLAAVLLAKAGMAFVVNLLFFGVYVTGHGGEASWHYAIGHMPSVGDMAHGHEVTEIMFGGLIHGGAASLLAGIVILVVGHVLVLALGVTSAGLQAVRLEYVEFFGKFYEGGGKQYTPFGFAREYTTED